MAIQLPVMPSNGNVKTKSSSQIEVQAGLLIWKYQAGQEWPVPH